MTRAALAAACAALLAACAAAPPAQDVSAEFAEQIRVWNLPAEPFTIWDNVHSVGTAGLSSFLVTTPEGHVLIDGALEQSAPLIEANIAALGFSLGDVKVLLNSHAHGDHAGGLAQLQRDSGARLIASAGDRPALEAGQVDYGPSAGWRFPPVRVDQVIGDGEFFTLGGVTFTAHITPGHTRGCTSWSFPVRDGRGGEARAFVHCSTTVAGARLVPEAYPGMVSDFRRSFAAIREQSADLFLAPHPEFYNRDDKRGRLAEDPQAFFDHRELQFFNERMEEAFEAELARQEGAARTGNAER